MKIVIDTREQKPYKLTDAVKSALKTGDYSIEGYEEEIAIERKSYSDLYHSLTTAKNRFKKQMKRLSKYPYRYLVIDSTVSSVILGHPQCDLPGPVALKKLFEIAVPLGVPVCFVDNQGDKIVRNLLYQFKVMADAKEGS
jgi:ERCC4-type nuclease